MSNLENNLSNKSSLDVQIYGNFIVKPMPVETKSGIEFKPYICFSQDEPMAKVLQELISEIEELYDEEVQISPQVLYPYLKSIQDKVNAGDFSLIELTVYLNEYFKTKLDQLENMTKSNKINFDNLNTIFTIGAKIVGYVHNNQLVGSVVHSTKVVNTMTGHMFEITGVCIMPVGSELKQIRNTFYIDEFRGVRNLDDLEVRLMSETDETFLRARGETFRKFCSDSHYWEYDGNMCVATTYGYSHFKADGRIMIDSKGFNRMIPSYLNKYTSWSATIHEINEENNFMCWPYLFGFSFSAKRWGELYIDHLKPITFDDNAFDYLVLDDQVKKMMKALIVNVKYGFKDIIGGKSGGCIFLLHGPPGVGKTLTCEAVAELLHKPLYSITVGELGTNVESLEKKLNNILEIANSWDAVILIDEADIFMEARNKDDIERNAMVSIFLRLLERHQGIMFLTTNRNENLDPAFKSRISIIIGYNELDFESRKKVWKNLLHAASIDLCNHDSVVSVLAENPINGRQIKNSIRMAQSLINDKEYNPNKNKLSISDIEQVMKFMV